MRSSELPAAINSDHCPNAAVDDRKDFSFTEPCGLNTPEVHPNMGTSEKASSEKTNSMDDDTFSKHPKHLLNSRGTLDANSRRGGWSEIETSSRRETSWNVTDTDTEFI
jgi:hypothetical protein